MLLSLKAQTGSSNVVSNSSTRASLTASSASSVPYTSTTFSLSINSSTTGVGDYVAQGLGIEGSSTASQSASGSVSSAHSTTRNASASIATASASLKGNGTQGLNLTAGTVCADIACATACDQLWQTWDTASSKFSASYQSVHGNTTYVTTSTSLQSALNYSLILPTPMPSAYTLCDGVPRVNTSFTVASQTLTTTFKHTLTVTTIAENYTAPSPQCSVPPDLCLSVAAVYMNESKTIDPLCDPPPGYMIGSDDSITVDDIYGECNIQGGPVRLLYWVRFQRTTLSH